MSLPYRQIFKQAYGIIKVRKFLWPFGLFLLWGNLLRISLILPTPPGIQNLLDSTKSLSFWGNFLFLLLAAVIFELFLLFFQVRGGTILAVKAIIDKRETSWKKSFYLGRLFSWRLVGISALTQLILIILLFILLTPVLYLYAANAASKAVILAVFGALIFIPGLVLVSLINVLGPMFVVLFDLKLTDALRKGFELALSNWLTLLLFGLLMFFINLAGIALGTVASSPFVILAAISYHRGGLLSFAVAAIILGSIIFLAFLSILAVFQQTVWVVAFLRLVKPVKSEEKEAEVPIPETV